MMPSALAHAAPAPPSTDAILDIALDQISMLIPQLFWNAPPRIVLDTECEYDLPFEIDSEPLPAAISPGEKRDRFRGRTLRAVFNLFSRIAAKVNHPDPFAIGPNEHTLVFRVPQFSNMGTAGRAASSILQVAIAWEKNPFIPGRLLIQYAVDPLSRETERLEGCRRVP